VVGGGGARAPRRGPTTGPMSHQDRVNRGGGGRTKSVPKKQQEVVSWEGTKFLSGFLISYVDSLFLSDALTSVVMLHICPIDSPCLPPPPRVHASLLAVGPYSQGLLRVCFIHLLWPFSRFVLFRCLPSPRVLLSPLPLFFRPPPFWPRSGLLPSWPPLPPLSF